jgi:hypothetical protein
LRDIFSPEKQLDNNILFEIKGNIEKLAQREGMFTFQ